MKISTQYPDYVFDEKSGIYIARAHLMGNRFEKLKDLAGDDLYLTVCPLPFQNRSPSKKDLDLFLKKATPKIRGFSPRVIKLNEYEAFCKYAEKEDNKAHRSMKEDLEVVYEPSSERLLVCNKGELFSDEQGLLGLESFLDIPMMKVFVREVLEKRCI